MTSAATIGSRWATCAHREALGGGSVSREAPPASAGVGSGSPHLARAQPRCHPARGPAARRGPSVQHPRGRSSGKAGGADPLLQLGNELAEIDLEPTGPLAVVRGTLHDPLRAIRERGARSHCEWRRFCGQTSPREAQRPLRRKLQAPPTRPPEP